MNRKKCFVSAVSAILITAIVSSLIPATVFVIAEGASSAGAALQSIHKKIDISVITGEGGSPEEITGKASSLAKEKLWYEYIMYSSEPVWICDYNSNVRTLFYDPYDYSGALLMNVNDSITDWSSANSVSVEYTTSNSVETGKESTTSTETSIEQAQGRDEYSSNTSETSKSGTTEWSNTWNYSNSIAAEIGSELGTDGGVMGVVAKITANLTASEAYDNGGSTGGSDGTGSSEGKTEGWTQVADRLTKSTGSSFAASNSWSTTDSKTISTTYNATYFNDVGSPLQWKVVKYNIYMPMYVEVQYKCDDEWYTIESSYCILTTVQGTCRAYMQNGVAYYEHWGTGEPVTWDEFWSGFFTEGSLLAAYKNKLYPTK